jgi:hypothetical protein
MIEKGHRLWIPPFLDKLTPKPDDRWHALRNIGMWADKWGVESSTVTYKSPQADGSVKEFTTIARFSIGSKYFIHLHKLPEIFATGPAAVNHIGIPTKAASDAKHFPVIQSPYKFGEDEIRIMALDCPIDWVVRFQGLLSNSPVAVTAAIRAMMIAKHPTRIKVVPISNGDIMRTNAASNLMHSIATTLGVETKNTKLTDVELADLVALTADDTSGNVLWDADTEIKTSSMEDADAKRQRLAESRRDKIEKAFGGFVDDEEVEDEVDVVADIIEPVIGVSDDDTDPDVDDVEQNDEDDD